MEKKLIIKLIRKYTLLIQIVLLGGILWSAAIVQWKFSDRNDKGEDIYWIYNDSRYIVDKASPYNRIEGTDMRTNHKYATYFPLFYLTAALIQVLGFRDYEQWLIVWRILNILVTGGISWIILRHLTRHVGLLAGILGAVFWLFHAYSLYVFRVAQIDFLAILFLIWSLALFDRNLTRSMILFGISLAFKQIAIFLIPIFIIASWQKESNWFKGLWKSALYVGLVPLLTSLPFLFMGARNFIYSVFFSATRVPASHFGTSSLDVLLELEGLMSILPMMALMLLVYVLFALKKIKPFLAAILILQIFIGYNSVLFKQYLVWPLVLLPFLISEFYTAGLKRVKSQKE